MGSDGGASVAVAASVTSSALGAAAEVCVRLASLRGGGGAHSAVVGCWAAALRLVGVVLCAARAAGDDCAVPGEGGGATLHPALFLLQSPAIGAGASTLAKQSFVAALLAAVEAPCDAPWGSPLAGAQLLRLAAAAVVARELVTLVVGDASGGAVPPSAAPGGGGAGAPTIAEVLRLAAGAPSPSAPTPAAVAAAAWRAVGLHFFAAPTHNGGRPLRTLAVRMTAGLAGALRWAGDWSGGGGALHTPAMRLAAAAAAGAVLEALCLAVVSTAAAGYITPPA